VAGGGWLGIPRPAVAVLALGAVLADAALRPSGCARATGRVGGDRKASPGGRWAVPTIGTARRRRRGVCDQAARIRSAKGPGAPSPLRGGLDSEVVLRAVLADNAQERMADVPLAVLGKVFATGNTAGASDTSEATTVIAKPSRSFADFGVDLVSIGAPSPSHDEVSGGVVSMLHGCIREVRGSGRLLLPRHALQRA